MSWLVNQWLMIVNDGLMVVNIWLMMVNDIWLVVTGTMEFYEIIIPTDFHIFQRG